MSTSACTVEYVACRRTPHPAAELQAASEKLAKDHLAKFSKGNDVPRGNMNAYKRFCDSVDVPPYPITFPLPSLAMFARCSTKNGHFSTFKADVQHVREAMASAWEGEGGYQALVAMDDEGVALKEFMAERRKVRVKGPSPFLRQASKR